MSKFHYHVIVKDKSGFDVGLYRYDTQEAADLHATALQEAGQDVYVLCKKDNKKDETK